MANAGPKTAQFDSQHRPITAGGFVKTGPIIFQDVAKEAGLTSWHHTAGTPEKRLILEAKGPGVCLLDYDNDGWLDIYLVNGSTYDALSGKTTPPHAALFHNNHDGTLHRRDGEGRRSQRPLGLRMRGRRLRQRRLAGPVCNQLREEPPLPQQPRWNLYGCGGKGRSRGTATWSAGATFGDYDGDGRLDLFVDGYVEMDLSNPPFSGSKAVNFSFCQYRGVQVMCGPRGLKGEHDHLFHNNGDGTFTDVSKKLGVDDPNGYYGLGALFVDVNGDGKPDLLVANDSTPNYLYMNKGDGTFEDQSYESGFALNADGREAANMGIAVGDYENNGHLAVVSTTFADDYKILFQNDGNGFFTDVSYQAGIAESSIPFVSFADGFLDYDNDGWKDLLIVNGHVYPQVDEHPEWGMSYAQRTLLYHNLKNGKFELVPAVEGTGLAVVSVGRGAAFGDIFNDGKIDVVINNMDGVPVLLRNVNPDHHQWVELRLIGGPKSPRDAVGATVYLSADGMRQRGDVLSGGSYLSSNDMRVHFGLGDATDAGTAEIHWPSGAKEMVKLPAVDRIYTITEGQGITGAMCDGKPCAVAPASPAKASKP